MGTAGHNLAQWHKTGRFFRCRPITFTCCEVQHVELCSSFHIHKDEIFRRRLSSVSVAGRSLAIWSACWLYETIIWLTTRPKGITTSRNSGSGTLGNCSSQEKLKGRSESAGSMKLSGLRVWAKGMGGSTQGKRSTKKGARKCKRAAQRSSESERVREGELL